jgi:transmembrane sensor
MSRRSYSPRTPEQIAAEAADWILRSDRGLSAAEQDDLSLWLAANPRHGAAFAEHRWGWDELDRLTGLQTSLGAVPDPDLFAPRARGRARRSWWSWAAGSALAAAAAIAVVLVLRVPRTTEGKITTMLSAAPCERLTLADGSVIELNRGAAAEAAYSPAERRVRLLRGEANFTVAKDPARPFIVSAGSVEVRAVGTVFNVRLDSAAVEVIVTEGHVRVASPEFVAPALAGPTNLPAKAGATSNTIPAPLSLRAGESTVVSRAPAAAAPEVVALPPAQLAARLAWQPRLLDFTDVPLAEIVAEFNRRNAVQLTVAEPALAARRLSATFRSDNVEGFVRLMESDFGMAAEWRDGREIVLRRAKRSRAGL